MSPEDSSRTGLGYGPYCERRKTAWGRIDTARADTGQYLIAGSQNLLLSQRVTESLAGRAAILTLLPFSYREMQGHPQTPLPWERATPHDAGKLAHTALWRSLLRGAYPELATQPHRDHALWHGRYVQTYLERDVRLLRQVGDLTQFQMFLRALAARSAQLLRLTDLSRDLGIAVNTVKAWLSLAVARNR